MMKFVVLAVCLVAVISAKEVDFLRKRKNHKFSLFSFYLYPGRPVTRQHSKESKSSQVESRDCLDRKRFSRESLRPSKRRTLPVGGMTRNGRKTFTPWPFRLFFFFSAISLLRFHCGRKHRVSLFRTCACSLIRAMGLQTNGSVPKAMKVWGPARAFHRSNRLGKHSKERERVFFPIYIFYFSTLFCC